MRTTNIRHIYNVEAKPSLNNDGHFCLEICHGDSKGGQHTLRLHFDSIYWVGHLAAEGWKVLKKFKSVVTYAIDEVTKDLRGEK